MTSPRLVFATVLCLVLPGRGQEAPRSVLPEATAQPQPTFSVECEMIAVPGRMLPALMPELQDAEKIGPAVERLQGMIARDEATLTGSLVVRGVYGQKVSAESREEVRFATEYDPPVLPSSRADTSPEAKGKPFPVSITPTNFEMRHVGQTLELEASPTADPQVITCNFVVQHVRLHKFVKSEAGRLKDGEKLYVEQPSFSVMNDQAQVPLTAGQPRLVGVHRLPGAEGIYELFLLTVRFHPAPAPLKVRALPAASLSAYMPTHGQVEVRVITLPTAQAIPLLPQLRNPATFAAAEARVMEMLASGAAELTDWANIQCPGGGKATAVSIEEIRYRTDLCNLCGIFEKHYSAFGREVMDVRGGVTFRERERLEGVRRRGWAELMPPVNFCANRTTPTSFEVRNTGFAVEVEAQMDSTSRQIDLSLMVQMTRLAGFEDTIGGRAGGVEYRRLPQPRFACTKVQTHVTLPSGGGLLLNACFLPGPQPRTQLFLLHANTLAP